MLKKLAVLLLLSIPTITCVGQGLFFDNLKNSTWVSEEYFNDSTIRHAPKIGLNRLMGSVDSLKLNKTIWIFKEDLTINYYNAKLRIDSIIGIYKYESDKDKGLLIINNHKEQLTYSLGIVSTGSFVLLIRKKRKNSNDQ